MLPRLSVVLVSRHRPEALRICLLSLRQQIGVAPEVIVVADPAGLDAVAAPDVKTISFDTPNISAARNLGLAQAAAEIVAFIDDDAVAEPTWAARLIAGFAQNDVVASTGFVRGRNGIGYQWRAAEVDGFGRDHPLSLAEDGLHLPDPNQGRAIKTPGTNCAFRAQALRQIGGFDQGFRFYLDETDVNFRLRGLGRTAISPLAQVVHGFLPSDRRRADRVPRSLFDIGASTALFLRRHAPDHIKEGQRWMEVEQTRRLLTHMVAGRIEPRDVGRFMADLRRGWGDGMDQPLSDLAPLHHTPAPFLPLGLCALGQGRVLADWMWNRSRLFEQAQAARAAGHIVTLLLLSPGLRRHVQTFTPQGFWLQTGGIWGRAKRDAPPPIGSDVAARLIELMAEASRFRPIC